MKKYFIIASAALVALCACTKNEPVNDGPQKEVSFQVANYLSQTKANVAFDGESFGVYAWYDSENEDEQNQQFMVNETVKQSGSDWKVDGKTYYWPKTGDVDFFAYYPVADKPWIACNDATHAIATPATLTIAGTDDLMYSSMAMNYNENVNPATYKTVSGVAAGVPILFHHALAKLTVNFKAGMLESGDNTWVITVNSAKLSKVCKMGTLSMSMDTTPTTGVIGWTLPTNSIWAPSTDREASIDLVAASALELTTSFAYDDLYEYSVLPQDLAGMEFVINFTIKASNDGGKTYYSTETVERTYPVIDTDDEDGAFTAAGNYWKMNTKITYNVTITPSSDEILFDPAVVDWEAVSASKDIQF